MLKAVIYSIFNEVVFKIYTHCSQFNYHKTAIKNKTRTDLRRSLPVEAIRRSVMLPSEEHNIAAGLSTCHWWTSSVIQVSL